MFTFYKNDFGKLAYYFDPKLFTEKKFNGGLYKQLAWFCREGSFKNACPLHKNVCFEYILVIFNMILIALNLVVTQSETSLSN